MKRREMVRRFAVVLPLLAFSYRSDIFDFARRIKNNTYKTFAMFLKKYPQDHVDTKINYYEDASFASWHREIHPYLEKELPLLVPAKGKIVELGVFKGESAQVLKNIFNPTRYMGVDLYAYAETEGVLPLDVRELPDLQNEKAAMVWNDISSWKGSPRSRLAALEWAKRNLVSGGVYIDEGAYTIPTDVSYAEFNLVHKGHSFTVFQRV